MTEKNKIYESKGRVLALYVLMYLVSTSLI